jgi:hypothetical protein
MTRTLWLLGAVSWTRVSFDADRVVPAILMMLTKREPVAFFQACSRLVPVWLESDVVDSSVRTQLAIGEFTNVVRAVRCCKCKS